ncbi:MAG TPA: hypothetical protein VHL98_11180 [Microvirga sp.]|jgi:hypothetical protein|nr:hypothetical protein [Microvirga sp.]
MGLVVSLAVEEPASIEDVAAQLQAAANALGLPAEATFRGVRCRAVPMGLASEIVRTFALAEAAGSAVERFATSEGGDAPANPVPAAVSDRQFAQALAEMGEIPWPEAEEWGATGAIPAQLAAVVAAIPDEATRQRAVMFLRSAQTYERRHPMTLALAAALGWTDANLDDLWRLAATL